MSPNSKRLCFTMPEDIKTDIFNMKREIFHGKSNSEVYRHLIRMGLDALKASETAKTPKEHT